MSRLRTLNRRLTRGCAALAGLVLGGCSLLTPLPDPVSGNDRLSAFPTDDLPIDGRVSVYWNENAVPFIDAEKDEDAAFVLGMVHAHLRLGQMEVFRRIARGRIAEMGGPLAADIDHSLRILNFGRAAAEMEAGLAPDSRMWLTRYVAGINHYAGRIEKMPPEFSLLGIEREPWTVQDVLAFGRLAGTDVNWLIWFSALQLRDRKDFTEIWARLVKNGSDSVASFDGNGSTAALQRLLAGVSKSGSNSVAVAGARTASGAALMANDPHLGITVPNLWLIAGLRSPSYHAVGLMAPGLPIFAIGRNKDISWGGTNMRSASSDLVDISTIPENELQTRRETVGVRWWFDRDITIRESRFGPVLSDAPMLAGEDEDAASQKQRFALRWTGHRPSDEIAAMLRVSRAGNFAEFRDAFETFSVPGQNMLYADTAGNIGQVMAVRLPRRDGTPPRDMFLPPAKVEAAWSNMAGIKDLPFTYNPAGGYLASANNRPADAPIPLGWFFSADDRMVRMNQLLDGSGRIGSDALKRLQQDVAMPSSLRLRDRYLALLAARPDSDTAPVAEELASLGSWDGMYDISSTGAVTFELFHSGFQKAFYDLKLGPEDAALFSRAGRIKSLLEDDLGRADAAAVEAAVAAGIAAWQEHRGTFANWGEMHRLSLAHPLSFLPLIGDRYVFTDFPAGGSSDSLMKTAHGTTAERHATRYGSNARHVSDLSDPDANWFAVLGGQDGWFNSASFLDQVPLWREGRYIQVPLRIDAVAKSFGTRMDLRAGPTPSNNTRSN